MKFVIPAGALLILIVLVIGLIRRTRHSRPGADSAVFHDLRRQLFSTDPREVGIPIPVPGTRNGVYGLAMELGFTEGTATVVALGDGTASLYLESGGGMIGAGRHERVHRAALTCIETADRLAFAGRDESEPPLPAPRSVCFHWLIEDGLRSAVAQETELQGQGHILAALYAAGQDLLTQMRSVASSAESATPQG